MTTPFASSCSRISTSFCFCRANKTRATAQHRLHSGRTWTRKVHCTAEESEQHWDRNIGRCKQALVATFTALALHSAAALPSYSALEELPSLDPNNPVLDLARIVPAGQEESLIRDLQSLEQRTGWKLRLLTRTGPKQGPSGEEIKRAWKYDASTGVVICDPTAPNILQFQVGDRVQQLLKRGFFIELQSRFGNQFYVRDEGEAAAVISSLKTMSDCLEKGGCLVVPGIPENQYQLTLVTSIFGGFIFGFSTRIPAQGGKLRSLMADSSAPLIRVCSNNMFTDVGYVRRRFIWPLLFAPLWGTLFISFGIGPIWTRTEERGLIWQNFLAFLVAAGIFRLSPLFKPGAADASILTNAAQKQRDAENKEE